MPCVRLTKRRSLLAARKSRKKQIRNASPTTIGVLADGAILVSFSENGANQEAGSEPQPLEDGDRVDLRTRVASPRAGLELSAEVPEGDLVPYLQRAMARLNQQAAEASTILQAKAPVAIAGPDQQVMELAAEDIMEEVSAPQRSLSPAPRSSRPSHDEIINAESRLGSLVFGPIPEGHQREFFHDRNNVWIWYEGWRDERGQACEQTVRYEVRPSGVYKKMSAGQYLRLEGGELENFRRATHTYLALIKQHLYHMA